jgi:hypothetical protein
MKKIVILSVALVALFGSTAFAQLTQIQDTLVGLQNAINLMNGDQSADSIQNLAVSNDQVMDQAAYQGLVGNFAQIGHAWGSCGLIGITQALDSMGLQEQMVGACVDPKLSAQMLTLAAGQGLSKADGAGGASALHQIVLKEDQDSANAAGGMNESAAILALQSSDLTGEAMAQGVSASTMDISTVQSQSTL